MIFCWPATVTCEAADLKGASAGQLGYFTPIIGVNVAVKSTQVYPAEETRSNTFSIGVLPNVQLQMENLIKGLLHRFLRAAIRMNALLGKELLVIIPGD